MSVGFHGVYQITATSAQLAFANGAGTSYDVQLSARSDFQFCACPTFNVPAGATYTALGLNQSATYFARARGRFPDGTIEEWGPPTSFRTLDGAARNTAPAPVMIEPAMFVVPEAIVDWQNPFGTTVPGFPIQNLARDNPTAWQDRRGGPDDFHAVGVCVGGAPVDTFALLGTNLPETTNVFIQGADTVQGLDNAAFQTPKIPFRASANLPGRPSYHGIFTLDQPRSYRWWRLVITDCPLPGNLLQIEHIVVGRNRVTKNHAIEKTESPLPLTTLDRRRSGMVDRVLGRPMRKSDFELQMLTEAQYETIYGDLWRRENEAVLVVPNGKRGAFFHDRILYGDLTGGRIVNPTSPRYNRSFTINSLI